MPHLSRRSVLALAVAAPALILASCAPTPPRDRPTPIGTPSPASPTVAPPAEGTAWPPAPVIDASFGPTGGHWPSRTPGPREQFDQEVEVEASWTAIASAIADVQQTVQSGGRAVVRIRPGALAGDGAGSSASAVLNDVGTAGNDFRILVVPRDGVGTVTLADSIRLEKVRGVSFVGIWNHPNSMVISASQDVAWAWSKGQAFNISANSSEPTADIEFVECVTPDARLFDQDAWAFRTAGQPLDRVGVIGCYIAGSYKNDGSDAHTDTLQLSGDQPITGLLIKDSAIFASTNAAFIPFTYASDIVFDHSLVVGGDRMLLRHPLPDGANDFSSGYPAAVNGAGSVDQMAANDSIFIGNVRGQFVSSENTQTSLSDPPAASSGAFVSTPALSDADAAWLDTEVPLPTDDVLRKIWTVT